jgi:FtsZ-binding cell division protein ZapB
VARRLFLHVGLPKSGTTYLQAVLGENKERLGERAHLLYPCKTWDDQVLAARDVLSANPHGVADPKVEGAWQRLIDEVAPWEGDAVVSMEWLGSAEPGQARRIVESAAPAQVQVVVTARDLARTIPAAWQEFVQNWEQWTWPEFLRAVTSENPRGTPAGNMFWVQQDLGRVLAVWRDVLPSRQIHVVTLPHPGAPAGELWSRFASVLGIDGSEYDAGGRGSNESLGLESAELMLRLNLLSRQQGVEWPAYNEMLKHALAKRGLSKRKHRESTLVLPPEYTEWTLARTAEQVSAVKASGAHVVGDLAELQPVFGQTGMQPDEVRAEILLEAALEGLVAVTRDRGQELVRLRRRITALREEQAALQEEHARLQEEHERLGDERNSLQQRHARLQTYQERLDRTVLMRVRNRLIEASERRPWVMRLRKVYSRLRGRRP